MKNNIRILLLILSSCVTIPLIAALGFSILQKGNPPDLRSSAPVKQISLLEKSLGQHQSVFLSPEYYPIVPAQDLNSLPTQAEAVTATADIADFYRLNRKRHFSLLILGTLPSSATMVRELIDSPLWILSDVSPWGYIISPNQPSTSAKASWSPPTMETLTREYPDAAQRTQWQIATAENLIAIRRMQLADTLLKSAASTGKCHTALLAAQASLAAAQGRWNEALTSAREAHHSDPRNIAATEILIRALTECGHPDEALEVARQLTEQTKNQETLFLLARAAYASNSKAEEIVALRSLVSMARTQHQQLGASLTYLGQAYARDGDRANALRSFQEAVTQPELNQEQRALLDHLIDHLRPDEGIPSKN
jgi:tetratricopeptide (TPR) repeat protein